MENKLKHIILITLIISLSACNYADIGGMFIVNESVNSRFEESQRHNKDQQPVTIIAPTDSYKIAVMADAHIGTTTNFDKAIQKIKTLNYNALILNGDMCNGNKSDFERYATHVKQLEPIPYFPLVGNHELYFGGWSSYLSYLGSSTYYFTIKTNKAEDLFICLDTGSGTLGSKQLEWFKNLLKTKRSTYRNCIIFTHNNLYRIRHTSSTNPLTEELLVMTELFARYKVNIVVAGHDHQKNIISLGNTNHITLNAMLDGFKHADFLTLSCTNGELDYQFTDLK